MKVDGGVFQVFIDGERILSAMDYVTTYDVGKVGVEAGNDILGTVHSFLVRGTKVDV